jgi:membrane protein DedA with SNARE-associated domain
MEQLIQTRHRLLSRRQEYAVGVLALLVAAGLAVVVAANWHDIRQVTAYGYSGAFILSILGGATFPIPVPVTAVYFSLGGLLKPWFGPDALAPAFIGLIAGFGEALGGLTTYATGYSGGASLADRQPRKKPGRMDRIYGWLMRFMDRRGGLALFLVSALINPFYYPVALAAGLTRLGAKRFFLITLAGKVIKCSFVAYAGYLGLRGLFEALGIAV